MNYITKNKTKKITFRVTQEEYQKYLSLFDNAKTKNGKKYTTSDFIRDCIFNKKIKGIKTIRVKQPSKCQKQRLQMLISTVYSLDLIAKSLVLFRQNNEFNLNEYLLKIDKIENFMKGELS